MSLSLFGLRVVTGGRRAISGPFIEYFCDISRSQLQRSQESATGGGRSDLQVLGSRKCYPFRDCFVPPTAGLTAGLAMTVQRPAKDYLQYRAATDPTKSNPVLLKETPLHKGATRLTKR